jgi:hypothetical protein
VERTGERESRGSWRKILDKAKERDHLQDWRRREIGVKK